MTQSNIKQFILKNVVNHPTDIIAISAEQFNISRTAVHHHMKALIDQGKINKTGNTKQTQYFLPDANNVNLTFNLNEPLDEFKIYEQYLSDKLKKTCNKNALDILDYGFTEMLNNAKDHSKGKNVKVNFSINKASVILKISDDGIGAFKKLGNSLNMSEPREVLFELSKGRLTSDKDNHSGEGIFFTSRCFDKFTLIANNLIYERNNEENDWTFYSPEKTTQGTTVLLEIQRNTSRILNKIFENYQGDDYEFNRTDILVDLAKEAGSRLIARSQAKRALQNLEPFSYITFDFKNVEALGQGFADQVFRVYQNSRQGITLNYINANKDVDFMIKHVLNR